MKPKNWGDLRPGPILFMAVASRYRRRTPTRVPQSGRLAVARAHESALFALLPA